MEQEKNEKFLLLQDAVGRFEDYEKAVISNVQGEEILDILHECLDFINNIIGYPNPEPYSLALYSIRLDLLDHIKSCEIQRNQLVVNDLTITATIPSPSFIPSLTKVLINNKSQRLNKKPKIETTQTNYVENGKLESIIKNTIIEPRGQGLEEIAGLQEAKETLFVAVIFPLKFPHLYEGRRSCNKVLLYGPPGTGKTQLAHCLAVETKLPLYCVSNSDLWSRYVGESEKLITTLFQEGQKANKQCIIFIDEIDSLCRVRNSKESEFERRFKNQLMIELSEMDRNPTNKIFFLGSTNRPWELDPAFIRRFQRRIYIPLPTREARLKILQRQSNLNHLEWEQILNLTEGWSGSDISELIICALDQPIKELTQADKWILTDDNFFMPKNNNKHTLALKLNDIPSNKIRPRPVDLNDFFQALKEVTRSVKESDLEMFNIFRNAY